MVIDGALTLTLLKLYLRGNKKISKSVLAFTTVSLDLLNTTACITILLDMSDLLDVVDLPRGEIPVNRMENLR